MVWRDYPQLRDRETLRRALLSGITIEQIARRNGCTRETVKAAMHHHNIRRPFLKIPGHLRQKLQL